MYGWVRDYNRLIGNEKRQEAEMLFERIESELDKKIPVNKQYLERARITEKLRNGRISNEEAIEEWRKNTCNNDAASSIWKKNIQNTVSNRICNNEPDCQNICGNGKI